MLGFSSFAEGFPPYALQKRAHFGFYDGPDLSFDYTCPVMHPITNIIGADRTN